MTTINWDVEIAGLQDLSVSVSEGHALVADALMRELAASADQEDGALRQKLLTARIAAEGVSAIENLGAIAWSIANRHDIGVLRRYLSYQTGDVRSVFADIQKRELRDVFSLPSSEGIKMALSAEDTKNFEEGLASLQTNLRAAANNYFALGGAVVRTYNKIKHGFPIIVRLDKLIPGRTPPSKWQEHVNVLTDMDENGTVIYTDLERSEEMLNNTIEITKGASGAWRETASLLIFMWERGLPLD